MGRVSESMRSSGSRQANQGEVWGDIADKAVFFQVDSATGSMEDTYISRGKQLDAYSQAFRAEPAQRGAVAAIDGKVIGIELFDSAATFAKYLDKLVRGYALDALETANGKHLAPAAAEVERFLERIRAAAAERFSALGEGEDLRLSGEGITGAALTASGRMVHLAGYVTTN
jgi:hypothetical protein